MVLHIKNKEVFIDKEDFELVSRYKWHINGSGYAVWRGIRDGRKRTVRMHRLITDCPADKIVDHINHNTLDNRRANLRICTHSDNMRNRTDQGKGYWFQKQNRNWVVEVNNKHIGCFPTEERAAEIAALVRAGGTYTKPARAQCRHGHSLDDAYRYGPNVLCRPCQSLRSQKYYSKKRGDLDVRKT